MREVFEDLKGYEDSYQISDSGRVFTKRRLDGNRIIYGRELSPDGITFIDNISKVRQYSRLDNQQPS